MVSVAVPTIVLAFCTWAVYLGGLAALQADCQEPFGTAAATNLVGTAALAGVTGGGGFSASILGCNQVYRYWWFVMAMEFVCILIATGVCLSKNLTEGLRATCIALFTVCTILFIQASDAFLTAQTLAYYDVDGTPRNRLRTTVAGAIMTATANCFVLIGLGLESVGGKDRDQPREMITAEKHETHA